MAAGTDMVGGKSMKPFHRIGLVCLAGMIAFPSVQGQQPPTEGGAYPPKTADSDLLDQGV